MSNRIVIDYSTIIAYISDIHDERIVNKYGNYMDWKIYYACVYNNLRKLQKNPIKQKLDKLFMENTIIINEYDVKKAEEIVEQSGSDSEKQNLVVFITSNNVEIIKMHFDKCYPSEFAYKYAHQFCLRVVTAKSADIKAKNYQNATFLKCINLPLIGNTLGIFTVHRPSSTSNHVNKIIVDHCSAIFFVSDIYNDDGLLFNTNYHDLLVNREQVTCQLKNLKHIRTKIAFTNLLKDKQIHMTKSAYEKFVSNVHLFGNDNEIARLETFKPEIIEIDNLEDDVLFTILYKTFSRADIESFVCAVRQSIPIITSNTIVLGNINVKYNLPVPIYYHAKVELLTKTNTFQTVGQNLLLDISSISTYCSDILYQDNILYKLNPNHPTYDGIYYEIKSEKIRSSVTYLQDLFSNNNIHMTKQSFDYTKVVFEKWATDSEKAKFDEISKTIIIIDDIENDKFTELFDGIIEKTIYSTCYSGNYTLVTGNQEKMNLLVRNGIRLNTICHLPRCLTNDYLLVKA